MRKHLLYLKYVLRHKWYVFLECYKYGIMWRGLIHDISKFNPVEWYPYANYFYGKKKDEYAMDIAWNNHQKRNKHHWQWWVILKDSGGFQMLPMPDKYRKEMLADWRGVGRALNLPDTKGWYLANKNNMMLHLETRLWVEKELGIID